MLKRQSFSRFRRHAAEQGYGLALLMVFVLSTVLIASSLQLLSAPTIAQYLGTASQDNLSARELALLGMDVVSTDMQTKLDAGTTVDSSYTYPVTYVNMPSNPGVLGTLDDQVGNYSASMVQSRANTYLLKVNATVGVSSVNLYRITQMDAHPYDCSVVESQILSGNIASVSNSDLQAYAQHGCMIKTANVSVTAPSAGAGATACADQSGSGTLNMASISCAMTITGTYSTVQLNSTNSYSASGSTKAIYSYPSSGARTFQVPGTVYYDNKLFAISGADGVTKSTYNHTFLFSSVATSTANFELRGGDANDLFSFNGNSNADIYTNYGNNVVTVNGTYGGTVSAWMGLGDDGSNGGSFGGTGTNSVYADTITASASKNTWVNNCSSGASQIYFNNLSGAGNIYIGWDSTHNVNSTDIIGCGVNFSGGTATCGSDTHTGNLTINGQQGADIISLNFLTAANTYIYGNRSATSETTTPNIIYTKGCSGTTTIQTNSTTSLVISAGNRASGCSIDGGGGNSVLLKKSGTTDAGTNSNFSRTITY